MWGFQQGHTRGSSRSYTNIHIHIGNTSCTFHAGAMRNEVYIGVERGQKELEKKKETDEDKGKKRILYVFGNKSVVIQHLNKLWVHYKFIYSKAWAGFSLW